MKSEKTSESSPAAKTIDSSSSPPDPRSDDGTGASTAEEKSTPSTTAGTCAVESTKGTPEDSVSIHVAEKFRPGDFLIIRIPATASQESSRQVIETINKHLKKNGLKTVTGLVVTGDIRIENLDRSAMAKAGWRRIEVDSGSTQRH